MKALVLLSLVVLCGCASTIEDRRKEKLAAYSGFPAETQAMVDTGRIKIGMPKDAVYIAWGKPAQVIHGESAQGTNEVWLYRGSYYVPYHYWSYGGFYGGPYYYRPYGYHYYPMPYLETDWYPYYYTSGEVHFENERVKNWRANPMPPY